MQHFGIAVYSQISIAPSSKFNIMTVTFHIAEFTYLLAKNSPKLGEAKTEVSTTISLADALSMCKEQIISQIFIYYQEQ